MIDVAIIGGGPAALGAALYAARGGVSVTLFEKRFVGGQASLTYEVDNYLGFSGNISGSELSRQMYEHVLSFGANFRFGSVQQLSLVGDTKKIITQKKQFDAKSVILAMGAEPALLNIPGEKEFTGKGVSYCATCDGNFFRGKTVCVVGGGNTAVEDAIYLSRIAQKVYIILRRDVFRASAHLVKALSLCPNVEYVKNTRVIQINGTDRVTQLTLQSPTGQTLLQTDALFVAVGTTPQTSLVKDVIATENGFILTSETMATNIDGVFAAGDIRKKPLRQIITAVSDGAVAGEEAAKYVNMHKSSF